VPTESHPAEGVRSSSIRALHLAGIPGAVAENLEADSTLTWGELVVELVEIPGEHLQLLVFHLFLWLTPSSLDPL